MTTANTTAVKTCRLLYFGPSGAGKRDNLRLINQSLPPQHRLSLATADPERQIAFRLKTERDGDWQVLVQAVDAGTEKYPTAGLVTDPPFDGVIFVVSSRAPHLDQSLAAMEGLKGYLEAWDLDLMTVPVVVQYNGREASDMLPVDRLEGLLNPWGLLSYPASSSRDEGVRETLKSVLGLTVKHLLQGVEQPRQRQAPVQPAPMKVAPSMDTDSSLGFEYGPPVPGSEISQQTLGRADALYDDLRPPVILPVKIPRRLLEGDGPVRILLEVEIVD